MALADDLRKLVRGEVEDAPNILEKYSRDASLFAVTPQAIFHPNDATDIGIAVRYATKQKEQNPDSKISLTPRSAGTDMSGGPLNTSIIVDMTAHFNRLLELSPSTSLGATAYAVVEPGMYFRDFDKETKKKNLELPSYTASRELNTVGGMVGNNSGGEKNLQYGKTARYVQELDVVLADGQVHTFKNLEGEEFKQKLEEKSFEGDLYREMAQIVRSGKPIIDAHKPQVEKNSSGYALWDIGDGVQSLNLARLMVGAQGTLGIVTKIKFKLVHPKPYAAMTIAFLGSLAELGKIVPEVLEKKPDSFESYDDQTFKLAVKYFPEFAAQMKTGMLSLGLSFLPEIGMMLVGGIPKLILIVEFREDSQEAALKKAEDLAAEIKKNNPGVHARVAKNEEEERKYWAIRRESFNLLRKKVRGKRTAPFIDDFVVPPKVMPEFLPKLEAILKPYEKWMQYTVAGHVGDGNFHIIPLIDPNQKDMPKILDELSHKVYDLVLAYNGSISGEHNDGFVRTPYVQKMFGPEMYALFVKTKKIFDPHNIFNPGKKVGTTFSDALTHLDLPKAK
ncbi:MAG TPA: FAD-binding oxidoreductase [Candidatus Paceibacterota bacterium]|nr:FAD-binding oxidoreductase [Candidatus Paceibacterota bacterium]